MGRRGRWETLWVPVLCLAAGAACAAGCSLSSDAGSGDAGADLDTGTGDGWQSPVDGSVWSTDPDEVDTESACECDDPLCGIGYTCAPAVKECACGTACSSGYYGSIGWGSYFSTYKCFEPCDEGGACAREGDVCTALYDGESLCLPRIEAATEGFDIKVVPEEQAWSITDAAQVDVALTVGAETRHLIMAYAASLPPQSGYPASIELAIMESGVGDFYELIVDIWQDGWAPGTVALSEDTAADGGTAADFSATLYHGTASGEMWFTGQASSGTIELLETPEIAACDGPGCPKALLGAIQIEIVGPEAEFAE
jgi:hypothetical protein